MKILLAVLLTVLLVVIIVVGVCISILLYELWKDSDLREDILERKRKRGGKP
jgi:hypothetical protein